MIRTAIVGGSGYTGQELLRLLAVRPDVRVEMVTSRELAGRRVDEVFPSLAGINSRAAGLVYQEPDPVAAAAAADVVFTAVPHQAAMNIVPDLLDAGARVVDLSADFRFRDPEVYSRWYLPHQAPELTRGAVYGLPELYAEEIRSARLVGNPGCYPTSVILAAAPLVKYGLADPDGLIADCKSGVSGAGRSLNLASLYCEANDGMTAYKIAAHRHTPEMEQEIGLLAGRTETISFTPHLAPMSRGILSTVYAPLADGVSPEDLRRAYLDFYDGRPFVRVRPSGAAPHTLDVRGSNFCDLGVFADMRTGRAVIAAAIDNLTRGASGQAVCCMNLMTGLDETAGLEALGLRP